MFLIIYRFNNTNFPKTPINNKNIENMLALPIRKYRKHIELIDQTIWKRKKPSHNWNDKGITNNFEMSKNNAIIA